MKNLLGALPVLLLAGCIFESDKQGFEFDVGFYAETEDIYAYDNAGVRGSKLGFGAEQVSQFYVGPNHDEEVYEPLYQLGNYFWPAAEDPWPFWEQDSSYQLDSVLEARLSQPTAHVLEIAGDSTRVLDVTAIEGGLLYPAIHFKTRAVYAGMPCAFSRFKGSLRDSTYGALPVIVTEVFFRATGDFLRMTARIDTAASRAREPRLDFSQTEFYGTMRVSCP